MQIRNRSKRINSALSNTDRIFWKTTRRVKVAKYDSLRSAALCSFEPNLSFTAGEGVENLPNIAIYQPLYQSALPYAFVTLNADVLHCNIKRTKSIG